MECFLFLLAGTILGFILCLIWHDMKSDLYPASPSGMLRPSVSAMARAFQNGHILERRLNTLGISELTVDCDGMRLYASWYQTGSVRSLSLDRRRCVCNEREAKIVVSEAKKRARFLTLQEAEALDKKFAANPAPQSPVA